MEAGSSSGERGGGAVAGGEEGDAGPCSLRRKGRQEGRGKQQPPETAFPAAAWRVQGWRGMRGPLREGGGQGGDGIGAVGVGHAGLHGLVDGAAIVIHAQHDLEEGFRLVAVRLGEQADLRAGQADSNTPALFQALRRDYEDAVTAIRSLSGF